MNQQIRIKRLSEEYPDLLQAVMRNGSVQQSRIGETRELVGMSLLIREPEYCIVDRDGYSPEFRDLEIAMLLGGIYDAELTKAVLPRASELITQSTAYGPRVVASIFIDQMESCEWELTHDPGSRRALVYIGRPDDLHFMHGEHIEERKGEMPCTALWQFILRGESYDLHVPQQEDPIAKVRPKLHMLVYMRSWDLVWGLSYDVPCFVANQMALAKALEVEVGNYVHVAGSAHIYERHFHTNVRPGEEKLEIDWLKDDIEETRQAALNQVLEMRRIHGLT